MAAMSDDMTPRSRQTRSLWIDTGPVAHFSEHARDVDVDVAIIGGGITGITAADLLKRAGKRVAVIELHQVGHGETGHTTAHLTEVLDISYQDLIKNFGIEGARLACQSSRKAIQRIEANIQAHQISCQFARVPGWKYTINEDDIDFLEDEADAALKLHVPNSRTFQTPLPFPVERAIRFEHQAQFHPMSYINALARTIPDDHNFIFENTRAIDVEEGDLCKVITDRGTIRARHVIIAANVPVLNRFFLITKIAAYRTYALAFKVQLNFDANHLFWDSDDPYHYIRSEVINSIPYLIVGGEDHKTGTDDHTEVHFQRLESWCRERFIFDSIDYRWSGQIINPVDGLPFVGRNSLSERVFVATGFQGNGMTFGTMAGMLLSDLILEQPNPWTDLYSATRIKPIAGARNYLNENVDFPTHLIGDRLSRVQEKSVESLREHEGRIVRLGGKKVAAYRSPEGELHLLSPVCPHLGCHVNWNEAEKSWDCPCHGSRFDPVGKLLNGPAVTDLQAETYDDNLPYAPERYDIPTERIDPLAPPLLSLFTCPLKPQ